MNHQCHRCNQPEQLALAADAAKWGKNKLRYVQTLSYQGVAPERIAANYRRATELISAVCGMTFEPTEVLSVADIVAVSSAIDGPWNTLALSELPNSGAFDGQLHQWFDRTEQLDDDLMVAMFAHELGHILGLGHLPAGNLMAPSLDRNILGPQPGDIAALRARYGPPVGAAPGAKPDTPPAGPNWSQRIQIEIPLVGTLSFDLAVGGFAYQPSK